uniref:60S ribosomal protein L18a n=1 Tax=Lygus hesperus TaxID=30085 RepID=A0A0A9W9X0_LYGHE
MLKFVNHLYEVIGRSKPTEKHPSPQIFRMKIFAEDKQRAMSRFWYFLAQYTKVKASTGEILSIREIFEKKDTYVKNYGIQIRYNSRSGTHNMYKEYRDVSVNGAIDQMYAELASRHRARRSSIWIIRAEAIPASKVRRSNIQQFLDPNIKFRLLSRIPRASSRATRNVFAYKRPCTFF